MKSLPRMLVALAIALLGQTARADRDPCSIYDRQPQYCSNARGCSYDSSDGRCESTGPNAQCSRWDGDQRDCSATPGCIYDYADNRCEDQAGPGPAACYAYDNDPRQCDATFGCAYDYPSRRCEPSGGPVPRACSAYNNDPQLCNATLGCGYDWSRRSCLETGGPGFESWCAGGPAKPSYLLRDADEARNCALRIASAGGNCAQAARYGRCDPNGAAPGWQLDPSAGWCSCDSRPVPAGIVRWNGEPWRP